MLPPRLYHWNPVCRIGLRQSFRWIRTSNHQSYSSSTPQDLKSTQDESRNNYEASNHESKQKMYQNDDEATRVQHALQTFVSGRVLGIQDRLNTFHLFANRALQQFGAKLNEVTGYEHIDALKKRVMEYEERLEMVRRTARICKEQYDEAVLQRAKSQREVNELLQRKSSWSDYDVSRFTQLIREDHLLDQEESRAKEDAARAEDSVDQIFNELMRSILSRYHEEQMWSDKIRKASTYGSLAALGLNLLVFVLAVVIIEPWKRSRLVELFQRKVQDMNTEYLTAMEGRLQNINDILMVQKDSLALLADQHSLSEGSASLNEEGLSGKVSTRSTSIFFLSPALQDRIMWPLLTAIGGLCLGLLIRPTR